MGSRPWTFAEDRKREKAVGKRDEKAGDRELGYGKAQTEGKPQKRWKDNLTAVGIGGAAASLISVLSEAAEGL